MLISMGSASALEYQLLLARDLGFPGAQDHEESFKDNKSRSGLAGVRAGSSERLSRLLMAPTIALSWLTLIAVRGVEPVH
jgi:hypothetical protein